MAPIEIAFDFLSPYAYLAWHALPAIAARHGRAIRPVPVMFAGLLAAHGTKGPAEVPAKRAYVFKDATRLAHAMGVPLSPPASHPFNPLLALRASSLPMDDAQRHALITALFAACWGGGRAELSDPATVARVASSVGLDGQSVVAEASADPAKARLRAQTEDAVARGAFGIPTMFVDGELFWGVDSLQHVERRLRGEDPVDPAELERWRDLPASAQRKIAQS